MCLSCQCNSRLPSTSNSGCGALRRQCHPGMPQPYGFDTHTRSGQARIHESLTLLPWRLRHPSNQTTKVSSSIKESAVGELGYRRVLLGTPNGPLCKLLAMAACSGPRLCVQICILSRLLTAASSLIWHGRCHQYKTVSTCRGSLPLRRRFRVQGSASRGCWV